MKIYSGSKITIKIVVVEVVIVVLPPVETQQGLTLVVELNLIKY